MPEAEMLRDLKAFINNNVPFAHHCGVVVSELNADGASALLPADPHLQNHVGTQHAGALFTAAETASGACMLGLIADNFANATPVVRSSSMKYRRPARGEITAAATSAATSESIADQLARNGKADFTVDVELSDADGQVVASAEMAWHVKLR